MRRGGKSTRIGVNYVTSTNNAINGTSANLALPMADVDYVALIGTVYFDDQEVEKNLTVKVLDEHIFEANEEHVRLSISPLAEDTARGFTYVGPRDSSEITISDLGDDAGTFQVQNTSYLVSEAASLVRINLTRTEPANSDVMLNLSLTDGTAQFGLDYGAIMNGYMGSSLIRFASGETLKTVEIQILNDGLFELFDETFNVSIVEALDFSGTRLPTVFFGETSCSITIVDDGDAGTFEFANSSMQINEAAGVQVVTVIRNGEYASGAVRVDYETHDLVSTATGNGVDYVSTTGTLYFADQQRSAQFNVTVVNDALFEYPDERIALRLFNVRDGTLEVGLPRAITKVVEYNTTTDNTTMTVFTNETTSGITILDDYDAGRVAFSSTTYGAFENDGHVGITLVRTEGTSSPLNVSVYAQEKTAGRGFDFMADNNTNFTVIFANGQSTAVLNISYINDNLYELPNEIFDVSIYSVRATDFADHELLGGIISPNNAVATIFDDGDAGRIEFTNATLTFSEGVGIIDVNLTRTGGNSGELTVYMTSTGNAVLGNDFTTSETHNKMQTPHRIEIVFGALFLADERQKQRGGGRGVERERERELTPFPQQAIAKTRTISGS